MLKWWGRVLRTLHLLSALVLIVLTVLGPRWTVPWLAAFWGIMVTANILQGGCMITKCERQMTQENVTIIDPFLSVAGIPITNDRRNFYTLLVGIIMLFIGLLRVAKLRQ